jgi:hypothetical protein
LRITVSDEGIKNSKRGRTYLMTFLDAELGDASLIMPHMQNLKGSGAVATVREEIKGSSANSWSP